MAVRMQAQKQLSRGALGRLSDRFCGEVVLPGDAWYGKARAVWNGTVDRYPAAVAYCSTVEDVVAAVRFARDEELVVAVRSGGHSIPGHSVCDFGMVIDLSRMRGVTVDPMRRTARVNGGALLHELDEAAQAVGLVCPVGAVSHTGVAGLTLGGGLGRLMRKFGLTIDNLTAVELVTAEGHQVRASGDEHPGLFWALRGAGANFGIATAFEFDLHPLDPVVTAGMLVYPIDRAPEVAQIVRSMPDDAPPELVASMTWGPNPGEAPFPASMAGEPIAIVTVTYAGAPAAAVPALQPLRALRPAIDTVDAVPYLELQRSGDQFAPWGTRCYWSGGFLDELSDDALDLAAEQSMAAPSPFGGVAMMTLGGAIDAMRPEDTAFSARQGRFWLLVESVWSDPAHDAANERWAREAMRVLEPFTMARNYVNDLPAGEAAATGSVYGDVGHARLVALKRAWDPDNVFRLNHNIDPRQ